MSDSAPTRECSEFWVTSPDDGPETPESRARCEAHLRWLRWKYQFFRELRGLNLPAPTMVLPDEEPPGTTRTVGGELPRDILGDIVPIIVDGS